MNISSSRRKRVAMRVVGLATATGLSLGIATGAHAASIFPVGGPGLSIFTQGCSGSFWRNSANTRVEVRNGTCTTPANRQIAAWLEWRPNSASLGSTLSGFGLWVRNGQLSAMNVPAPNDQHHVRSGFGIRN